MQTSRLLLNLCSIQKSDVLNNEVKATIRYCYLYIYHLNGNTDGMQTEWFVK